jgi:hypothetical protein
MGALKAQGIGLNALFAQGLELAEAEVNWRLS